MIVIAILRSDLDTLETDPSVRLQVVQNCDWCHKQIGVAIVMLGSQQDHELTSRNASPLLSGVGNFIEGILNRNNTSGKIVRVRLKTPYLKKLRERNALTAKAPCPYCQMLLEIRINPV